MSDTTPSMTAGGTAAALPEHLRAYRDQNVWRDRTLGDVARERAMATPDAVVFAGPEGAWSVADVLSDAEALSASLFELGLRPGDVISFQLPNWPEAGVVNLAAALTGLVVNPIVPIYRDAEVRQMLSDSGSKLIFLPERFRKFDYAEMIGRLRKDLPALVHVVYVRGGERRTTYDSLIRSGRGRGVSLNRVDPGAVKLLLYTSGTTGRPKGVLHSHNGLARVIEVSARQWRLNPGDAVLMPSPVTHITGFACGLEWPFLSGTRTVLMETWDAAQALQLIESCNVVGTVAATPFLRELVEAARQAGTRLPSLRFFGCGGAEVPPRLIQDANAIFAQPAAFRVFGCSELPLITLGYQGADQGRLAATTDGEPVDYAVRVVDDKGAPLPAGREGEIQARGPAMFLGYADASQTREAMTPDGYFRTGDLGLVTPEGAVLVTGRKKDLIIRGGENISAKEIEDVLHRHPAVAEAAVVSMPHPRLGEGICAFIVPHEGKTIDPAALAGFVADSGLAKQKCPERVECVPQLPKTAAGKVRKDLLRKEIRDKLASDRERV